MNDKNYCSICEIYLKNNNKKHWDTKKHIHNVMFWCVAKEIDAYKTELSDKLKIEFIFDDEGMKPILINGTKENFNKYCNKLDKLNINYNMSFYTE